MTRAVLRKELATLWTSPLPYALGAGLAALLGVLFVDQLQARDQAVTQPLFPLAGFLLLFAVPVLAMRSIAEEDETGSLHLLQAAGLTGWPLVAGKWLATWLTTLVVLLPAGAATGIVAMWGDPDPGPALSGFCGLALLAATVAGLGLLSSSLTRSPPVAALGATFVALVLWFSHVGSETLGVGPALASFSFSERLRAFASGGIDTADVVYFATASAVTLVLAALAVDAKRLR